MSTKYIGKFPEFFREIVALLGLAKREIVIFCDFPAYASFSEPHTWLDYEHTIRRKALNEGVHITLTCLPQTSRARAVEEQFFPRSGHHQAWDIWKRSPGISEKLEQFLSAHEGVPTVDKLSKGQFLAILAETERRALEETFASAHIQEINIDIRFHFWLVDGASAVFAIGLEQVVEYGFATKDQELISRLIKLYEQHKASVPASAEAS